MHEHHLVGCQCRDEQTGKPRKVSALLRTTGGDCSQAVGKSMASLFAGAGSPSLFYWDSGLWQLSNKPAGKTLSLWGLSSAMIQICMLARFLQQQMPV